MNKAELIKALNLVVEGINGIKVALDAGEVSNIVAGTTPQMTGEAKAPVAPVKEETKVAEKPVETPVDSDKESELNNMKYNELKKYASSLGVDCKGTRPEITARILAHFANGGVTPEAEEVVESPVKEDKKSEDKVVNISDKKKLGKKSEPVVEEEPEEEPEEEDGDEFDTLAEQIISDEDTDVADIISALKEVGVKANKKDVQVKLAQALRDGLIDLDEEDEEEEEVADEPVSSAQKDGEEEEPTLYTPDLDLDGVNNPETMTEARRKAVIAMVDKQVSLVNDEKLTEEDIVKFLEDTATEDEIALIPEDYELEDVFSLYLEIMKRFIDDDGDTHEPADPCQIGEDYFCCGHKVKYVKKTGKFVCEVCGEEYDAE